MSTWPKTRKQLYAEKYDRDFTHAARPCKRCGIRIEFWKTPSGAAMPMEEVEKNIMVCHFATCKFAEEFRRDDLKPNAHRQKGLFE